MDFLTTVSGLHDAPTALVDPFRTTGTQQEEVLGRWATEIDEELLMIRAHHQALAAELETSRTLVGAVHTALASLTAFLRSWQEVEVRHEVALLE
jgi:hypothetical protein